MWNTKTKKLSNLLADKTIQYVEMESTNNKKGALLRHDIEILKETINTIKG